MLGRAPERGRGRSSGLRLAVALTMGAPRPAAGSTHAIEKFLLRPSNTAFSGCWLLGILDPADELIPGKRGDVFPCLKSHRISDKGAVQVGWQSMGHPTGDSDPEHTKTVSDPSNTVNKGVRRLSLRAHHRHTRNHIRQPPFSLGW